MKMINNNAATLMYEKVETLETDERHNWKCIYMRLHDKQERFNRELRTHFINRAIVDMLVRDEGYIYFCEDGDIFIMFEGALKPIAEKLSSHFGDLDPEQLRGEAESGMFVFFDLSKHWHGFHSLAYEKANRMVPARERLQHTPAPNLNRVSA